MRKLIILLILTLCAGIYAATEAQTNASSPAKLRKELTEEQKKHRKLMSLIRFDSISSTFIIDISREEAIKQGIPEDAYDNLLESLEKQTREAREIIERGGKFTFLNVFALPEVEQQFHQLVGYMKSEADTCYLTITPEEAMEMGFSKEAYEKALRETEIIARDKKNIIQTGNNSIRTSAAPAVEPQSGSGE